MQNIMHKQTHLQMKIQLGLFHKPGKRKRSGGLRRAPSNQNSKSAVSKPHILKKALQKQMTTLQTENPTQGSSLVLRDFDNSKMLKLSTKQASMDKLTRKLSAGTVNRKISSFKLENPQALGSIDRVQTLQNGEDQALPLDFKNERRCHVRGKIVANSEIELPVDGFDEKSFFSSEKNQQAKLDLDNQIKLLSNNYQFKAGLRSLQDLQTEQLSPHVANGPLSPAQKSQEADFISLQENDFVYRNAKAEDRKQLNMPQPYISNRK